jgi:hypothetical protein
MSSRAEARRAKRDLSGSRRRRRRANDLAASPVSVTILKRPPGGQYVLDTVAAAVIGGTSLFGGHGRMLGAVLGGLVIGVIYNGLSLLGLGPARLEHLDGPGAARRRHRGLAGPPGHRRPLAARGSPAVRRPRAVPA